jgi:lipid II:glycine glycyltransferase (peptidoglycan interpeptide bridge formation enzyme)
LTNKERYQSIAPLLPLFFQPWWLDVVCKGEWDVVLAFKGKDIVGVWPFQIEKKLGFKLLRNPLLTAYLGPLVLNGNESEIVQILWQQLPNSDMLQWSCLPEFKGTDVLNEQGVQHKRKVTFHINLKQTQEEIWQQIHPKRKNDIRKAEQDLRVIKNDFGIRQFVDWHKITLNTKNYPYSFSFFKKLIKVAEVHNASISFSAYDKQNNCLGHIWLAMDQNRIYYLLSATPTETHRGAISLLIWNAVLNAKEMGLEIFDFEGSMNKGIADFFQRFGGVKTYYSDYSKTNSPLWKLKQKLFG